MKETLQKLYLWPKEAKKKLATYWEFQVGNKKKISYKKLKS